MQQVQAFLLPVCQQQPPAELCGCYFECQMDAWLADMDNNSSVGKPEGKPVSREDIHCIILLLAECQVQAGGTAALTVNRICQIQLSVAPLWSCAWVFQPKCKIDTFVVQWWHETWDPNLFFFGRKTIYTRQVSATQEAKGPTSKKLIAHGRILRQRQLQPLLLSETRPLALKHKTCAFFRTCA